MLEKFDIFVPRQRVTEFRTVIKTTDIFNLFVVLHKFIKLNLTFYSFNLVGEAMGVQKYHKTNIEYIIMS